MAEEAVPLGTIQDWVAVRLGSQVHSTTLCPTAGTLQVLGGDGGGGGGEGGGGGGPGGAGPGGLL